MSNKRLINNFLQLLPRSWLERNSSKRSGCKLINRTDYRKHLNPDLPFHEQIKNQAIYSLISTVEPHFEIIHDLLIWKYPDQSIACFLGINLLYWFIVFLSSHLITAVAFIIFMYKINEFWSTVIWPEIALEPPTPPSEQENWTCVDPNLLSAPEITRFVDSCLNWVKNRLIAHWNLRSSNHLAFFLINLLIFTGIGYLGTIFSGAIIIWFFLIATLLAPAINVHFFPFIKSSDKDSKKANLNENDKLKSDEKEDNLDSSSSKGLNDEKMDKEKRNSPPKALNDEVNLDKTSKLIGQILENTKCYLNQMFDEKVTDESSTEEFIKKKEMELSKAHDFLTDVVLNQDPSFPVNNNELNNSFKYLENEFKKLDKLKDNVNPKSINSIESNLVASHFGNDSPILSSDGEDDFEIIPNPSYQ